MSSRSDSVECLLVLYVFSSGASLTFTMPFTFSVAEHTYVIYVCGFCDGNSVNAVVEYQQRFPNRRIPTRRVFTRVYQTLRDTGTLPGVRVAAESDVNEGVDEEEGIVQMVRGSPCASTRRIARCVHVPHTRGWRTRRRLAILRVVARGLLCAI